MVVCSTVPWSCRVAPVVQKAVLQTKCLKCPKFDPLIVIVKSGLPAATVDGDTEEMDGFGVVDVT